MFDLNNIYNVNCYKAIKEIPDKSIDLVIIDPPYEFVMGGVSNSSLGQRKYSQNKEICELDTDLTKRKVGTGYSSGGGCFGTKKRNYHSEIQDTDVNKDKDINHFVSKGITNEILDELVRVLKKVNIYIFCNKNQLRQLLDYFDDLGCNIDLLTWHKTNPIPTCNNTYLSDTEYIVFARENGVKLYGSVETKKKYYLTSLNVKDKELYKHPTIKPLEIISNFIINSSQEGDVVFDCFLGSGTTCVAAKQLNRQYLGFELNPTFYQIAKDRLSGLSQKHKDKLKFYNQDIFGLSLEDN